MCGLVGVITNQNNCNEDILNEMVRCLAHRGPDNAGTQLMNFSNTRVGLGHARLSILDLSKKGHQPKESANGRYVIVHNGEIYNFKEIQKELIQKGYVFESQSDTEVILNAFSEWGTACVDKFIGMFAFAIVDKQEETLYIFRDRAGVKPLYFYKKNGLFCFASELKALMKHPEFKKDISMDSMSLFLKYGYIPAPHSIFEHTFKLQPGHFIKLDLKTLSIEESQYWNVLDYYNLPKKMISEQDVLNDLERLLESACEYRMVSDVPVGLFLSGGYDSTAVAALLQKNRSQKIKTFTIGFEDQAYDEAPFAKEIATILGTDHTEYYCNDKDVLELIPLLSTIYDEPFADSSAIPTILVSRVAREQVTVSLSADGGDEIFGGYTKYTSHLNTMLWLFRLRYGLKLPLRALNLLIKKTPYSNKWALLNDSIASKNLATIARKKIESNYINGDIQNELLQQSVSSHIETAFDKVQDVNKHNNVVDMMMAIDYKTYMVDDILHKVDRATMSIGLEGREPLLDHRLIEYAAQLPSSLKIKNGNKKHLLKQIVHKYVPQSLMDRPKKGFGIPFDKWFADEKNERFNYYLSESMVKKMPFFNAQTIEKMKEDFKINSNPLTQTRLWCVFIFNQWAEKWL